MGGVAPSSSPADAWAAAGRLLTPGAWVATAVVAVSALALGWFLVPLAVDVVKPAPKPLKKIDDPAKNAEQQKITFDGYLAQVKGRSLFYVPPAPQASAAVEPVDTDKPPPPPSTYGGPSIVAMLSDVVWFSNGRKLRVGEKHDDLEVVALAPPWSSRLKWKGVEFDVGFFERSRLTKEPKESPSTEAATQSSEAAPAGAENSPAEPSEGNEVAPPSPEPEREPRSDQARGGRDRRQEGGRRPRGGEPR